MSPDGQPDQFAPIDAAATERRTVKICNQKGLHARAAARFVKTAGQFAADVFRQIRRLQRHGLALDIADLADEEGSGAEGGLLAQQEWGRWDVLEGDRPAAGRGGRARDGIEYV